MALLRQVEVLEAPSPADFRHTSLFPDLILILTAKEPMWLIRHTASEICFCVTDAPALLTGKAQRQCAVETTGLRAHNCQLVRRFP